MSRMKLAIVATLLATSATALADGAKYERNQDVSIKVNLSDRVKPIEQKPKGDHSEVKPELNADQILDVQGLVGNIRAEQEQILIQLIQSTPDSAADEKSDYFFRLGELYAQQQRYYRLTSAAAQIKVDSAKSPQAKAAAQQQADQAGKYAKLYLLKAVKVYKALTDNPAFRNYPKMDMALFYYGFTLQGGHYMKEARDVYDKLLKNYPNSRYVPEAHLSFADYYFDNNDLPNAEARYKEVLKFPKSSVYWYAMYKMGWCYLNEQNYQGALESFLQVAQATKHNPKQETLNHASRKDFVRAYAEIGKPEQALNAFKRVDQSYAFTMLGILADLYMAEGKSDKAIYTYREMMKQQPRNKDVCLWQYNIAHAMLSLKGSSNDDKIKEIENLVHLYGALKGKSVLPQAEAEECHDNASAMSGELARAYHSEAVKTKNPESLRYAEHLYKVYLETFTDASDWAETQYYYAELLWSRADAEANPRLKTEEWKEAADEFTQVVKTGKVNPKLMKESAYAAVLGWKNALDIDPTIKAEVAAENPKDYDKKPDPKPIPEAQQKMMAAFDVYIKYIHDPKDEDLIRMKFSKANIYRRYNHFDEAIPIFKDILEHHRDSEAAEYSANLLLDTYNRLQRYDDLIKLVNQLLADQKFLDGKDDLKQRLVVLQKQSKRKAVEAIEADAEKSKDFQKYVDCGQGYLDIYNQDPTAADNDVVLYNAGVCFQKGKSIGSSIRMFSLLQQYYPKSNLAKRALAALGKSFGDVAFYDRAADKLEEYAKKYAGEKDAYDAMSDAVFYRKGMGEDQKAIDDTKYFIKTFGHKKQADAANADFALTSIYEKNNDNDGVIKHLRDYLHDFGEKGGADRVVIAHTKIGMILWTESCPVKPVDGACVKITRQRATAARHSKRRKGADIPTQCGPDSKIKLTVIKRDERKKREAMQEFQAAAHEFERKAGKTGGDEAGAKYYYAQAKFAVADDEYEKFLNIQFPTNLNFDPNHKAIAEKSKKRFNDWLANKKKESLKAATLYSKILDIKDAANSIAAAARLAQINQEFSDELFTAEIPPQVRTGPYAEDAVDAYCDALTTAADPLTQRSIDLYKTCLGKSTDLGWFSSWSKLCERELGQIKPEEFPTASELRGEPNEVAPVTATEPPPEL